MKSEKFFPPKSPSVPLIYAYEDTHQDYTGFQKVGYITGDAKKRVCQQYPIKRPGGETQKERNG